MTREEAREILIRYRAGTADEKDVDVMEALRIAEGDRELQEWLAAQAEFHNVVRAGVENIAVPADLKDRILASSKVTRPVFRREWLALAASLLILAAGTILWMQSPREEVSFANFRSRMTSFALRTYQMDVLSNDPKAVRDHLAKAGAPADFALPPGVQLLPVKGGGRLAWQNKPVAMMCFELPEKETLYMFVIDAKAVRKGAPAELPKLVESKRLNAAEWQRDGRIYLIAANTDARQLEALARQ